MGFQPGKPSSLKEKPRMVDPSSVFYSLSAENPRSASKEEIFVPDKEKSVRKLEEFFKKTLEGLSSIFDAVRRKKIPFKAMYPYADVPKPFVFVTN